MSLPLYAKGDTIALKSRHSRMPTQMRTSTVTSVRPDYYGKIEYRVRFDDEVFDRCVSEADIDQASSAAR